MTTIYQYIIYYYYYSHSFKNKKQVTSRHGYREYGIGGKGIRGSKSHSIGNLPCRDFTAFILLVLLIDTKNQLSGRG